MVGTEHQLDHDFGLPATALGKAGIEDSFRQRVTPLTSALSIEHRSALSADIEWA